MQTPPIGSDPAGLLDAFTTNLLFPFYRWAPELRASVLPKARQDCGQGRNSACVYGKGAFASEGLAGWPVSLDASGGTVRICPFAVCEVACWCSSFTPQEECQALQRLHH